MELEKTVAANITELRKSRQLTQLELAEKLNYSDKTISKWERGEAIPDAYVLTQMAEIFGVTVDYLLSSHDAWESPEQQAARQEEAGYSVNMIIAISVLGVWTMALTIFVLLWLFDIILWETFIVALPVSILTYMVLICVFRRRQYLQFVIAAFVLSMFILLYFTLPMQKPWQLFLIAIPAEIIVFLSCNIRRRPRKKPEN